MFTGIIEETGRVESLEGRGDGARLRIGCAAVLSDAFTGSSIAVNGCCLTALDLKGGSFAADVAPETMRRTNIGDLRAGSLVNLERPLSPQSRLSGHIVQGHIDGTGELLSLETVGNGNWWLRVRVPEELERYLVFKGSIAIDGISLTIASIEGGVMSVTIIPHTYEQTNLKNKRTGDRVNLECDVLAKHVEKLLQRISMPSGLSIDKLREQGY
ncbi:MAG: riboflavin synthase [Acidobacteria bacterium]|nr:riboflavin synthase [Acidobacteriota bacterium]